MKIRRDAGPGVVLAGILAIMASGCGTGATASSSASSEPASPTPESAPSAEGSTATLLPTTMTPADEPPPGAIVIHLGPGPVFDPEQVTASGETLTFFFDASEINPGSTHNFKIGENLPPAAPLAESDFVERSESAVFTVTGLPPGTYRYWCSVDEHHSVGMIGTLIVES